MADAFDAMTSQRPYSLPIAPAAAVERLRAGAGSIWDPSIVAVFVAWLCAVDSRDPRPPYWQVEG